MRSVDFLAIGDPVVDDFIRLKEARVHCRIDDGSCEICMKWGSKIPFESVTTIAGVGNAANAAVAAARLGIKSALIGITGDDRLGDDIRTALTKEGLDTDYLVQQRNKGSNHHYVLWFESERTILVKHESYAYALPHDLPPVKVLYLSSLSEDAGDAYYEAIALYLENNPETLFAFQPGTFQMKLGTKRLKRIYARSDLFFCNKEEAELILGKPAGTDVKELLAGLRALGPKSVVMTDGAKGAYAANDAASFFVPMYPDPKEPFERTGAGDAFASTVTAALMLGKPLEEAVLWGPINSMAVVQKIGAQEGLLTRSALEKLLAEAPAEFKTTPL